MDVTTLAVAELLPHDPPMVLIDKVLSYDENSLVAEVAIRPDSAFCGANGVPGWVGIEYMAQAIAAHAGASGRLHSQIFVRVTCCWSSTIQRLPIAILR